MQLLSLPQEILACVLKYSNFGTLTKIRKINRQVDRISIRFGINMPKVIQLLAWENPKTSKQRFEIRYLKRNMFEYDANHMEMEEEKDRYGHIGSSGPSVIPTLEKQLKKIRPPRSFLMHNVTLNENWRNLLQNMRHVKNVYIQMTGGDIQIPLNDFVNIARKFKSSSVSINRLKIWGKEVLPTDSILCSLLPAILIRMSWVFCNRFCPEVTDATLLMLQSTLPLMFTLTNHVTSFTVDEVFNTIKIVMGNKKVATMTRSQKEMAIVSARCETIEGCSVNENAEMTVSMYKGLNITKIFGMFLD